MGGGRCEHRGPCPDCASEAVLPDELDVDGMTDSSGVRFIGKARRGPAGTWTCLADVGGALCRVEVRITPGGA